MKLSTEIQSIARLIGEERAVEAVAKAGFTAWDFSMFDMVAFDWSTHTVKPSSHPLAGREYLAFARRLKQIGLDNGVVCNQSHAPFPSDQPQIRSYFKRAIECTAEAGGSICVIHPDNNKGPQENAEMYVELLPFARECGVKIATENMWNWDNELNQASFAACATPESFCAHVDAVNDDYLIACLDIGHAEMRGLNTDAVTMIRALGSRLQALHIHDNDKGEDHHQLPFSMDIDFAPIVAALREIGYGGDLTLEAPSFLKAYTAETVDEGVRRLADSVKQLAKMFAETGF